MQWPGAPGRVILTPFARLPEKRRKSAEKAFLDFFELAVETDDEREEEWAYGQLKAVFAEAIAEEDDRAPRFFEAMAWASQRLARRAPS